MIESIGFSIPEFNAVFFISGLRIEMMYLVKESVLNLYFNIYNPMASICVKTHIPPIGIFMAGDTNDKGVLLNMLKI
jgi:hypothetical protein